MRNYANGQTSIAGTLIDGGIVNGARGEFILNAHRGTKGTNHCMLYCVRGVKARSTWRDASDVASENDAVKELTWHLCHASVASTRAMSVPAPVHYAEQAAERAMAHFLFVEDVGYGCGGEPVIVRDDQGYPTSFGTSTFTLDAKRDMSTCGMIFI
jgi:eukaryotic translation initiation factor 2C